MGAGLHNGLSSLLLWCILSVLLPIIIIHSDRVYWVLMNILCLMSGLHRIHELRTGLSRAKLVLILPTLDWLVASSLRSLIFELVVGTWGS